jgi:glutamine cyclotransferase
VVTGHRVKAREQHRLPDDHHPPPTLGHEPRPMGDDGAVHLTTRRIVVLLATSALAVTAACSGGDDEPPAALTASTIDEASTGVPVLGVEVLAQVPHDASSWTEGLVWHDETIYESAGRVGVSKVFVVDPATGDVLQSMMIDTTLYAEGLALVDDELIQLTWTDEVALVHDLETLTVTGRLDYEGEGWGLCFDGERLVMSDGSDHLTFRDPETFDEIGDVKVTLDGSGVQELNELECVGDRVYANVWHTDTIVEIDPGTGEVTTVIDASALRDLLLTPPRSEEAVLNGIAHDPDTDTFWLTGKLWPSMFQVRFVDQPG